MTIHQALAAIVRERRLVVITTVVFAAITTAYVITRPRTYTSASSFTPTATRQVGSITGLAAQLGMLIPGTDGNQSPAFYADLVESRTILEPLVSRPVKFSWQGSVIQGTFTELARVKGPDSARRHEAAIRKLRRAIAVSVAAKTGVVRVETQTAYPALSAELTRAAIELLNRFNVDTRQSQGTAQRTFLEHRLAGVAGELRAAEEAARDFRQRNRGGISPQLQLEQERLEREVSTKAQVHATLVQALEQAKLDEIRDTPLITVIETARIPVEPDGRGLVIKGILAIVTGLVLGSIIALLRYAFAADRAGKSEGLDELSREIRAASSEFRAIFGRRRGRNDDDDTLPPDDRAGTRRGGHMVAR